MLGVGLMVGMVGFGSEDPEFKSHSAVELIRGGVDSACHPSEVCKNEYQHAGMLCRSGDPSSIVSNSQGDCFGSTNALHRVWSQWMDLNDTAGKWRNVLLSHETKIELFGLDSKCSIWHKPNTAHHPVNTVSTAKHVGGSITSVVSAAHERKYIF